MSNIEKLETQQSADAVVDDLASDAIAPTATDALSSESKPVWAIAIAFALLFLATFFWVVPRVEGRLDSQSRERLADAGINPSGLNLVWDYRNLTVSGYLPNDISHEELSKILLASDERQSSLFADGIRHLKLYVDDGTFFSSTATNSNSLNVEEVSLEISSDGEVTKLIGAVQDQAQSDLLRSAALNSGVEIVDDRMDVMSIPATEALNTRIALLANIIRQLSSAQITRSEVTLNDSGLYYRITARDKNSAAAIENAASGGIKGFRITGGVDILSDNSLDLLAQATGEKITLSGKVYSAAQLKRLTFAAGEAVGSSNVIDQMTVAALPSASVDVTDKVDRMADVVSRFAPGINGEISLQGDALVVNAQVGSAEVQQYLSTAIGSARSAGLSVTENIQLQLALDESQSLQAELDQLIDEVRATVVFSSGASDLSDSAKQTLGKVGSRISAYSDLLVEIEGHTDDVGRATVNETLSQSRANAVKQYLAQNSVAGSRLIAVGYGHRRPVELNDTAEGRQANRRVHFTVLQLPSDSND